MDVICNEIVSKKEIRINVAGLDPVISTDPRILINLVNLEKNSMPTMDYFQEMQRDIKPYMRKIVTSWMLEVCDEQRCEEQVFPLAINYMDRLLCNTPVMRDQLQLLAVCCLLLASKIRQCYSLSVDLLCAYTDNGCSADQVRTWELLLLSRLQWNLSGVTAFDYIDHILQRVPWGSENIHIRQHALTLMSVSNTETLSILTPPSVLAAACICSATRGLKSPSSSFALHDICRLIQCDPFDVELTVRNIELVVAKETAAHMKQQQIQQQELKLQQTVLQDKQISPCDYIYLQPETPTDPHDVLF